MKQIPFRIPRRRPGVALPQLLIAFTLLAAFVAFAVDYGMARLIKSDLQYTIDAAALAGCSGLTVSPAQVRARAKSVASDNRVNGQALNLLDSDIELGTWNANTRTFNLLTGAAESSADSVRVTGQLKVARGTNVNLNFLPLLSGKKTLEMTSSTVASRVVLSEDIVLVQDVSGSFSDEIGYARSGDQDLLDALNTAGGTSSFGLVAFTGTAKTVSSLKKVTSNYNTLKSAVTSLGVGTGSMPSTSSGTDIAAGIEQAQAVFDAYVQASGSRSMVIVSDGESSSSWSGKHPGYSAGQLLTMAQQDANTAWSKGIHVFVVFWDQANSTTSAANLATLVRGKGVFVHVTDPTKISESIANVFVTTKLVK